MEDKHSKLNKSFREVRRLLVIICCFVGIITSVAIYLVVDPELSAFKSSPDNLKMVTVPIEGDDFDTIENGIHIATGFVDAPGMMETVQNCTTCHSSKLIIQNRMSKERWVTTIRWMQESQNLWDLGKNEDIIIDYLVTNYPPQEVGRRANLSNLDWYTLKD